MSIADRLRAGLVGEVRALFNDAAKGEAPVQRSENALIPPGSVAWRVHGDVTTMMIGGMSALMLQMLHPAALSGVWDHSDFRADMIGRLRRTARFIAQTTYAERAEGEAAIARVRRIHAAVAGQTPAGALYAADDPALLAWVHVAGAMQFLEGWRRFGEPGMRRADQDAYFADVAPVARMLGADPVPVTRTEAERLFARFRPELQASARSREVAHIVLDLPARGRRRALAQRLMGQAAVDLLPDWARVMHRRPASGIGRPAIDAATYGTASLLRWAFASPGR